MKYLITNLVYGPLYFKLFTERHLPSVLDESNLPRAKDFKIDVHYHIFTDRTTLPLLEAHPIIKRLALEANVEISVMDTTAPSAGYESRYPILMGVCRDSIKQGLEQNFDYVTAWVADLVVARDFFPRIWNRMNEGHDAVFVLPIRGAFESTGRIFHQQNRAFRDLELYSIVAENLHPLWIACTWPNEAFARMPYAIVFRGRAGLLARSYSVTPIIFKPNEALTSSPGMIDGDIPQHFKNPFWCENWIDAPVAGVEPIFCHYPPFGGARSTVSNVKRWAHRRERPPIHPSQRGFVRKTLYFPSKKLCDFTFWQKLKSDFIAWRIS